MAELAPGFRFYPTEEELLCFYLPKKLEGKRDDRLHQVIPVIHIYDREPTELPSLSGQLCRGDAEQWFFFTPRQEREARGGRPSRTTASGYWKATGSPNYVYSSENKVVGVKKTMVFYKGKAPCGSKTMWKMNEYRAIQGESSNNATSYKVRHEYSLCRIYVISGTFQAFDRRPLPLEVVQPSISSQSNVPLMSETTIFSSSPETDLHAPIESPTTDYEMGNAIEPLSSDWELNLDELNWL
jgi:hypothetical protein